MAQEPALTNQIEEKTSRLPFILGLVGLFLILVMTAVIAYYPFHYTALDGQARIEKHVLYLTNNSDYKWNDVRLLLNTDYKYNLPVLEAHDAVRIELGEFKKDDGTLFNVDYAAVDLYITAVTPEKQTVSQIFKYNNEQ
jgi:hypothetical protein